MTDEVKNREEDEIVAILLNGVPEVATLRRESLEKIIRSAFTGGWKMATLLQDHAPTESVQ